MLIQKKITSLIFITMFMFSLTISGMENVFEFYVTTEHPEHIHRNIGLELGIAFGSITIFCTAVFLGARLCGIKQQINIINRRTEEYIKKNNSLNNNYGSLENKNKIKENLTKDLKHVLSFTHFKITKNNNRIFYKNKTSLCTNLTKTNVKKLEKSDSCPDTFKDYTKKPFKGFAIKTAIKIWEEKDKINRSNLIDNSNIQISRVSSAIELYQLSSNNENEKINLYKTKENNPKKVALISKDMAFI